MEVFVVLALAMAVAVLGVLGVVALHLWRTLAALRAAVVTAGQRMRPLVEDLQAEAAVSALEAAALERSVGSLRASRRPARGIPRTSVLQPTGASAATSLPAHRPTPATPGFEPVQ